MVLVEGDLARWQAAPHEQHAIHALHQFCSPRLCSELPGYHFELTDGAKKAADSINAEIENDEDSTARSALAEGQGTAVMVDYMLAPMGKSLENSPELVDYMKNSMSNTDGMPMLAGAPILLRESLTFPYREGLGFVQALMKAGGKKRAFADALKDPPHDTHQILHPDDYLAHRPTPVMHMPDLTAALGKSYEKYDVGSIGEFDLTILFKQFADDRSLKEVAPKWDGGMYYAATKLTKKSAKAGSAPASPAEYRPYRSRPALRPRSYARPAASFRA